ncbi:MAG: hypothetical protein CMM25_03020 [Rhodospirillaceae bacterium]|nr:hypothetical protein [Rhodospirillaceae bacterium]
MTLTKALNYLSDANSKTRENAAHAISTALNEKSDVFCFITNVVAKDKAIDDDWRNYSSSISSRNIANLLEDHVVDALVATVQGSYEKTSHRYYRLKADWLNKTQLNFWDRNAPLPGSNDSIISWGEAKEIVLASYKGFSPTMGEIGSEFFEKNWIDAAPSPGKASGAFSHPTVPSANPFILLNYMGSQRDVMTLAHELGHGVHQVLAAEQGPLLCNTPLTLAETASVFGEMLTFRQLLNNISSKEEKRVLIANKIEDMLNTVVRQIAFHLFEAEVHAERRNGELSLERINQIWMQVQSDSLGPAIRLDKAYECYWMYVSHFVHVPFYVYAYAFGDCLVNSLYKVYSEKTIINFEERYLELLRSGGKFRHKELLLPFGLDASNPLFWSKGIQSITDLIDELEELF